MAKATTNDREPGWIRRLWRDHEEGVLYVIAVVVYIPAGVFLKTIVLNWMIGILFPLIVVYLIPTWIRHVLARRRGTPDPADLEAVS